MLYQLSYAREACILAADVAHHSAAALHDGARPRVSWTRGLSEYRGALEHSPPFRAGTTGGARTATDTAKLFDDAERHRVK